MFRVRKHELTIPFITYLRFICIGSIVVKFRYNHSVQTLKSFLTHVSFKNSQYNFSNQFPPQVMQRRRALVPIMLDARKKGKTAVLVRDKLYINRQLYSPPTEGNPQGSEQNTFHGLFTSRSDAQLIEKRKITASRLCRSIP